jgi:hypothetical protein
VDQAIGGRRLAAAVIWLLGFGGACGPGESRPAASPAEGETAPPPALSPTPVPAGTAMPSPPVIVGPESVAGWWDGSNWVSAEGRMPQIPALEGETYRVVGLSEEVRTARGSAPQPGCEVIPGAAKIEIPGLVRELGREPPPIAVSHVPDPLPRPVEVLNPRGVVYREASAALLKERGVQDADPDVVQVVKADMDGDGRNEVIVVAERIADPGLFARADDYSVVFLRRVVDERLTTTVVEESIPVPKPGETPFVMSHRVAALADLNGDGRMELALSNRYYEGAGVTFHELKPDGTIPEVLNSGCGA